MSCAQAGLSPSLACVRAPARLARCDDGIPRPWYTCHLAKPLVPFQPARVWARWGVYRDASHEPASRLEWTAWSFPIGLPLPRFLLAACRLSHAVLLVLLLMVLPTHRSLSRTPVDLWLSFLTISNPFHVFYPFNHRGTVARDHGLRSALLSLTLALNHHHLHPRLSSSNHI